MNPGNCALASGLVSATYVQQGQQALGARLNLVKSLLSQRKMPMDGWDDATIEMLLQVSVSKQHVHICPSFPSWLCLYIAVLSFAADNTVLYTGCSFHG